MKVLLPLFRSGYAFRSFQLAAAASENQLPVTMDVPTTTSPSTSFLAQRLPPLMEGSKRIILVRHAETDWNTRGLIQGGGFDVELNEDGHAQAQVLADELHHAFGDVGLDVVVSSHLARSEQTANIVSQAFLQGGAAATRKTPVRIINHKFGEMHFGNFEGLAIRGPECNDETRARFHDMGAIMHENKDVSWPGGESFHDVERRALAGLQQVLCGFADAQHVCIVAHGRFNKILLMALLGLTGKDSIQQGNTGINVLDVDSNEKWKAHAINYLEHAIKAKASSE